MREGGPVRRWHSTSRVGARTPMRRSSAIADPEACGRPSEDRSAGCSQSRAAASSRRADSGVDSGCQARGDARSGARPARRGARIASSTPAAFRLQIEAMLPDWTLAPVVAALQAMRGTALVNAATLIGELGDLSRFANPRQLMAYLGLVPSEHSSGASVRRGGLTKAGNSAARRLLIEAAWCYRFPARVSRELLLRQEEQPKPIREIAWKAQLRLCARYRKLARTGKPANVVTAAIARELAGFIWAIARRVPPTAS